MLKKVNTPKNIAVLYSGFTFYAFGVFIYRSLYFGLYKDGQDLLFSKQKPNFAL